MKKTTRLFRANRAQAVRLAKPVEFPEHVTRVAVLRVGSARLIVPAGTGWDGYFDGPGVSADFLREHEQPMPQDRRSP